MNKERYPLAWPEGKPRTPGYNRGHSPFKRPTYLRSHTEGGNPVRNMSRWHSMYEAVELIDGNVRMMGGSSLIVSTNVKLRMDGLPYSGQAQPADTGAAVYFEFKKRPVAFACDKFNRVECNLYSIGKTIEATRAIERWGSATIEQSFRGFMAIPEKTGGLTWWTILGTAHNATEEQVKDAYRGLAKIHHPDKGGPPEKWMEIRQAFDQAQALFRQ